MSPNREERLFALDTKQVVARFGAERQVLAMMDHPMDLQPRLAAGRAPEGAVREF